MNNITSDVISRALNGMDESPSLLIEAISFYSKNKNLSAIKKTLFELLTSNNAKNDARNIALFNKINMWDFVGRKKWNKMTAANSRERRDIIYKNLGLSKEISEQVDRLNPLYLKKPDTIIDSYKLRKTPKKHDLFLQKITNQGRWFYWEKFKKYLKEKKKFDNLSLLHLDSSTHQVLIRLGSPADKKDPKVKGLVVGYVQSGKTTHFSGLITKAIDCGYKLIIVLAGLTDLLRSQTQRRLDMDFIGKENILKAREKDIETHEYSEDADWKKFIEYGFLPRDNGKCNIQRITNFNSDFETAPSVNVLKYDYDFKHLPLWHYKNRQTDAKIIIIKKNETRLETLISEVRDLRNQKNEIPVLIIDDESDQASQDILNPRKKNKPSDKRGINEKVCNVIKLFPKCKYVGYTATPFANVLANPKDNEGLFPEDFILSLEKPSGYMGPREFTDIEYRGASPGPNEKAHIRSISERDERASIQNALDSFVLAGAIKIYREKQMKDKNSFKHHTMLYHVSRNRDTHGNAIMELQDIWIKSLYGEPGSNTRLKKIFLDFKSSWIIKGKTKGLLFPKDFNTLKKYVGLALAEMKRNSPNGIPLLKVNSDEDNDTPEFSSEKGVWKILVGGDKLSRGYTIEGLTVSYFKRNSTTNDTLLQMGRWFGYREKYCDLVRLFLPRAREDDPDFDKKDIYRKFECLSIDEERLREDLQIYSGLKGITPRQVYPLVYNSHPRQTPTARNKRYYAEIDWMFKEYREPTRQAFTNSKSRKHNISLFENILLKHKVIKGKALSYCPNKADQKKKYDKRSFSFLSATLDVKDVLGIIKHIKWEKNQDPISSEIRFLEKHQKNHKKWLLVLPLLIGVNSKKKAVTLSKATNHDIYCIERNISSGSRINAFNSPEHVIFAKWLAGDAEAQANCSLPQLNPNIAKYNVLLFWPTFSVGLKNQSRHPVSGFSLTLQNMYSDKPRIAFRAK